ncbi:MAG: histidinol dehydrogenase [Pseudomonadota bacterium]
MAQRIDLRRADGEAALVRATEIAHADEDDVREAVRAVIADVRRDGFVAVQAYTERFDGFRLDETAARLDPDALAAGAAACAPDVKAALERAAARIAAYHEKQRPEDALYTDEAGVNLGWRWTAVDAAGLYAPGGRAAYPSSVLMNAIPAKVAGVARLTMVTPTPNGAPVPPAVAAAAAIAGVDEVFTVGGAQAIAALAFGAGPIAPVDVVVGPGNAYVAEAKRQVYGRVGVDSVAGPSEILVIADAENDPAWIAADLMSQAEHDPSSRSILVTTDDAFADAVTAAVEAHLAASPRREIAGASWRENGVVVIVEDLAAAAAVSNRFAPEHLELAVADPAALAAKIRHAGAIFLGRHAPEAVGDYVAGPNHVLPTAGGARHASGLSVLDFMKRSSLIGCDAASLARIGPDAATLADAEGLPSHAASVRVRLTK